jgi:hypothetical protein
MFGYFYGDVRTHLFHAKASRQPTLPHEPSGVRDLVERHERLTRFYLDLLDATTGVRRMSGAVTVGGFEMMMQALDRNPRVLVTDDPTPIDESHQKPAPGGGIVIAAPAARDRELEQRMLRVFRGRLAGSEVGRLARITRTMLEADGGLISASIPEGDLRLVGIDWLEPQMEVGLTNVRLPKQFTAA